MARAGMGAQPPHPGVEHPHVAMLATIMDAALAAHAEEPGLAIDYAALPDAVVDRVMPWFGLVPSPADRAAMAKAAARDAKAPEQAFDPATVARPDDALSAAAAQLAGRRAALLALSAPD